MFAIVHCTKQRLNIGIMIVSRKLQYLSGNFKSPTILQIHMADRNLLALCPFSAVLRPS